MKTNQRTQDPDHATAGPNEANNVDKIRDILFGSQMRDYDGKFAQLEERLNKNARELGADVKQQLASLETFVKAELAGIADQIQAEAEERSHAIKTLLDGLGESERQLRKSDQKHEEALGNMQAQLVSESKQLTEKIRKETADLSAALKRQSETTRGDFTTRKDLAELFAQLALHLRGEGAGKPKK